MGFVGVEERYDVGGGQGGVRCQDRRDCRQVCPVKNLRRSEAQILFNPSSRLIYIPINNVQTFLLICFKSFFPGLEVSPILLLRACKRFVA